MPGAQGICKEHPFCLGPGTQSNCQQSKGGPRSPPAGSRECLGSKPRGSGLLSTSPTKVGQLQASSSLQDVKGHGAPPPPPRPLRRLKGPCSSTLERGRGLSAKFQLNPQALII